MEIQEKITERSRRNPVFRIVHATSDKETFASWRSELNRILHVFNVGSIVSVIRPSLTLRSQIELTMDTYAIFSDIRNHIATMVSDLDRTSMEYQKVADGKNPSVSTLGHHSTLNKH